MDEVKRSNTPLIIASTVVITAIILLGGLYFFQNFSITQKALSQVTPIVTPKVEAPSTSPSLPADVSPTLDKKQSGIIEGNFIYPSEVLPDTMKACAYNLSTKSEVCSKTIKENGKNGYMLELDPGNYYVYAQLPGDPYKAYYDEFVTCGLKFGCPSHKPIEVVVKAGVNLTSINPHDWYDDEQRSKITPTP
jgi:hypothetical protein